LEIDSGEKTNLVEIYPEKTAEMHLKLACWRADDICLRIKQIKYNKRYY